MVHLIPSFGQVVFVVCALGASGYASLHIASVMDDCSLSRAAAIAAVVFGCICYVGFVASRSFGLVV